MVWPMRKSVGIPDAQKDRYRWRAEHWFWAQSTLSFASQIILSVPQIIQIIQSSLEDENHREYPRSANTK